jgi:NADPH:quinone reductase-like Zn-dependent oxidoreductase
MIATEAWVLYKGPGARNEQQEPGELRREIYFFPDIQETEVLTEPIYGGWEANLSHAISRKPIDICQQRDEEKVIIGNSGVVRVLKTGSAITHVKEGDLCLLIPHAVTDRYGYIEKVFAYDAPHTMGLLAKRSKCAGKHLVPLPSSTRYALPQWASMARYLTAWSNWLVTYRCLRSQISEEECVAPFVWGWGGGVSLAELQLANYAGCRTAMIASTPDRLSFIEQKGIQPIDRNRFRQLRYDAQEYNDNLSYKAKYLEAERAFLNTVREKTEGEGVHIFIDNIGTPVYPATLKALAREGIITTCGWKHGMEISHLRAVECIARHIHVYTHAMRYQESLEAISFAVQHDWMPQLQECVIYSWDDVPQLARLYEEEKITAYFPLFAVNPLA